MSSTTELHSQIASIVEVLANSAVAEICKAVEDGYAVVNLEMSRSVKENECLRRRVRLLELQVSRYRAEQRLKSPLEGAASSRVFPGVRLLRTGRDTPTGSSLQSRNRSLNRSSVSQPQLKTPATDLDQDPDQDVVTTTKTEPSGSEEDSDLIIVKVEGGVSVEDPNISNTTSTPTTHTSETVGRTSSQTEGQETQENPASFWKSEVEKHEDNCKTSQPSKEQPLFIPHYQDHPPNQEQPSRSAYQLTHFPTRSDLNTVQASMPSTSLYQGSQEVYASSENISNLHFRQENFTPAILPVENNKNEALLCKGNQTASSQDHPLLPKLIKQPKLQTWKQCRQSMGTIPNEVPFPFSCIICHQIFTQKSQLRFHEKAHKAEKPYKCDQCGKIFEIFCHLKRHKQVHTGARPHRCASCGKHFSTANNLKVHQSVHTGERKFKCSTCGKSYAFLSNLIRHQAVHATVEGNMDS